MKQCMVKYFFHYIEWSWIESLNRHLRGGSPYYAGIAKILKAYEYSLVVDVWGDCAFIQKRRSYLKIRNPHYDDDATIYPKLITLLTEAVTDSECCQQCTYTG